jgi:hypothetical protein
LADIIVNGPGGQVRRWPLPDEFTYGEFRTLKTLAGVEPAEVMEALKVADAATIMALAVISAARAGATVTMDELDGLAFGAVTLEDEDDRPTEVAADAPNALPATTPGNGGNPS